MDRDMFGNHYDELYSSINGFVKGIQDKRRRHEENRGVHRLVMDHGPNALDRPLMAALRKELASLAGAGAPPVVLASAHGSLFCPGWDLKVMADAPRDDVAAFLAEFNGTVLDIFSYPGPTAAEIAGHAVAAGCLLVLACDLRVMAEGDDETMVAGVVDHIVETLNTVIAQT